MTQFCLTKKSGGAYNKLTLLEIYNFTFLALRAEPEKAFAKSKDFEKKLWITSASYPQRKVFKNF